jgi:hypothetical protein
LCFSILAFLRSRIAAGMLPATYLPEFGPNAAFPRQKTDLGGGTAGRRLTAPAELATLLFGFEILRDSDIIIIDSTRRFLFRLLGKAHGTRAKAKRRPHWAVFIQQKSSRRTTGAALVTRDGTATCRLT